MQQELLTSLEQDLGYLLKYTVVLTESTATNRKIGQKLPWGKARV